MRNIVLCVFISILAVGNVTLSQLGRLSTTLLSGTESAVPNFLTKGIPMGDTEEKSEEDSSEEEDGNEKIHETQNLCHVIPKGGTDLQFLYQHNSFKGLKSQVIIPPPRG